MTEADWQRRVLDLAKMCGWRFYHSRPAMNRAGKWATPLEGDPGFPDLLMTKGRRLLAVELKAETGRLRPDQIKWLDALKFAGASIYVWKPKDWDTVVKVLAGTVN